MSGCQPHVCPVSYTHLDVYKRQACFVSGLDEGMKLAEKYGVDAIFVDTDKNIWYNNPDVLNSFEFTGKDSGYVLNEYNQAHS